MTLYVRCPSCDAHYALNDDLAGKNIRCKVCQTVFQAPEAQADAPAAVDEPARARAALQPRPGMVPPLPPLKVRSTPRRRGPVEREPARNSTGLVLLIIGGAAALLLLVVGGGLAAYLLWPGRSTSTDSAPAAVVGREQADDAAKGPRLGAPGDLTIKPPKLTQDRMVVDLGGNVGDVAVGGGGRFLVLHLPQQHKLAVFDVNETRIVKEIPIADDTVKFTACLDKLVVVLPGTNVVERWDLMRCERETSVPLDLGGRSVVKSVAMGSASRGPLLVYWAVGTQALDQASVDFFDLDTLKKSNLVADQARRFFFYRDLMHFRPSADGKVFGGWCTSHSPQGVHSYIVADGKVAGHYEHQSHGHVVPGPDGRILYTGSGQFTNQIKAVGGGQGGFYLPAAHGQYYLRLAPGDDFGPGGKKTARGFTVHATGDNRPIVTVTNIELPRAQEAWVKSDFTNDKRIHFLPAAKVILTLPAAGNQIVVHHFDVDEALGKSGVDYLAVTSKPKTLAERGKAYRYQLEVKSKKGGVKYRLEAGPNGMDLSTAGLLTWNVPGSLPDQEATVIVAVADGAGQEILHSFKITVVGQVAEGPPVDPVGKDPKKDKGLKQPDPPAPLGDAPLLSIKPPALAQDKLTVPLPDKAENLAIGGGGRYLILHLPQQRKLAIFDVNEARFVKELPQAEDSILFTAGIDKLVVVLRDAKIIQRWSLQTFERELTVPLEVQDVPTAVVMGSASRGPILVASAQGAQRAELAFYDLGTLKPLDIKRTGGGHIHIQEKDGVRASADGQVFGIWRSHTSPQGLQTLVLAGNEAKGYYEHITVGHVIPGQDGKVIYTCRGLYTQLAKKTGQGNSYCLPAQHGPFYLAVGLGNPGKPKADVTLHIAGDEAVLAQVSGLELPKDINPWAREKFGADKRIHLLPDAKLIITIPNNESLVLHRFDATEALEKSGKDFLLVTSSPPVVAQRGTLLTYQVMARSNKGGLKYWLEEGPKDMAISPDGKITWQVPDGPGESVVSVVVSISNAGGQKTQQSFKLTLVN
jgi:predicted Zn finger-like uncharacterized protein